MDESDTNKVGLDSAHHHCYNIIRRSIKNFYYLLYSYVRSLNRFGKKCLEIKEKEPNRMPDFGLISDSVLAFPLGHSFELLVSDICMQEYVRNALKELIDHFKVFVNSDFNKQPYKSHIAENLFDIQFYCASIPQLLLYCKQYSYIADNWIKQRHSKAVRLFMVLTSASTFRAATDISLLMASFIENAGFNAITEVFLKTESGDDLLTHATIRYLTTNRPLSRLGGRPLSSV